MKSFMSYVAVAVFSALAGAAVTVGTPGFSKTTSSAQSAAKATDKDAVKVEFYVMSQCPFGVQVENGVKDALDKLGNKVDFQLDFIGNKGADGTFTSLHGPNEVAGDIAQLCVKKYAPAKLMDVVTCQNKDVQSVATNWDSCGKDAKIDTAKVKSCIDGDEGKTLLTESFARATARGAQGSPTIFIAGKSYEGRRGSRDFLKAICDGFSGTKPEACTSIPESPKVAVTVISDKRCADCNTQGLVDTLRGRIGNPVITELDYSDPQAKQLLTDTGLTMVPAVLFDDSVKADKESMESLGRWMKERGKFQSLEVGGQFTPACADEGGCKLAQCKGTIGCRAESPAKLELFVMSQCPFGVQALNSMQEVLANVKGVDFSVNYIASGTAAGGFQSLHGPAEVDENIRELCAIKYYGKGHKYMDYILCRNKEIRSTNWQQCATGGIDANVISKCASSDMGKKLLEENIKIGNAIGISGSPTWVSNGRYKFSGLDAQTIKTNLCQKNPNLQGCDKTLTGSSQGGVANGAACGN